MSTPAFSLFQELDRFRQRPAPFSVYSAADLWTDPHIAARMLEFHLDPHSEPASRPHDFIDRSARWITDRFGLKGGIRVADFGCGPGLYTSRFAAAGARVTGIDFSASSLAHARGEARRQGLAIDYIEGDYLDLHLEGKFDLITLIYCDLCPLSPAQRGVLLKSIGRHLAPGGSVLLDVFTNRAFGGRAEKTELGFRFMGGFWAPADYWGVLNTFCYEEEQVVLDRYTIIEPDRTRTVHNWLQYFSRAQLEAELAAAGLQPVQWLGNVAGDPDEDGEVMAVVARTEG